MPRDKYPTRPTKIRKNNNIVKDLKNTFLNLRIFGFLTAEAAEKKLVKQLKLKTAIPKFSKKFTKFKLKFR